MAHVREKTARLVGAEEPFGFFLVFVRGCLRPSQVKIKLLSANGSLFGKARGWSGPVTGCDYRLHRGASL
ncbi:MAG: hypothetical protein ACTHNP_04835 [Solirubrobacterales bacterium]